MGFDVVFAIENCIAERCDCEKCPVPQSEKNDCTCGEYIMRRALEKIRELTPPVEIGDTVKCACEESDEHGNPVTVLVPYEVCGVMRMGGKWYVLDGAGERYEVGTRYCITE